MFVYRALYLVAYKYIIYLFATIFTQQTYTPRPAPRAMGIYYRTEKLTEASPHDARSESPCAGTKLLKQSYRKCSEVFRGT